MLGFWRCHSDYQQLVERKLSAIANTNPESILEYKTKITKLYIFDLDPLFDIIAHLYSTEGRPSNQRFRQYGQDRVRMGRF